MKKLNFLSALLFIAVSVGFISCEREKIAEKDTTKPVINLIAPADGDKLTIGDMNGVHFDVEFMDNEALSSYKVDIHNNFDGHSHAPAARVNAATDSIAYSFNKTWDDIAGKRNTKVHHHQIRIPRKIDGKPIKTGKYHLVVYCLDKAGNESFVARDIELVHTGGTNYHDHDHDHEHEHSVLDQVDKIEVITHYGHLHGPSFHANAQPVGSPFLRRQVFTLKKNSNNVWSQISFNGKDTDKNQTLIMEGETNDQQIKNNEGGRYSFEFIYYDKNGKRINSDFVAESKHIQTLFSIEQYTDNKTKEKVSLTNGGENIISYIYRDTNPENKTYKKDENTELANNLLGLKGYMALKKSRITFDLTVNIVAFKEDYTKEGIAIYNPKNENNIEEKITLRIPINIITKHPSTDEESTLRFEELGKYYNIDPNKLEDLEWGDVDPESSQYWM